MLLLNSNIIHKPIISLQTGTRLATISKVIVDPMDLKVFAFLVNYRFKPNTQNYLMSKDIREFGSMGAIIDSTDEFVTNGEVLFLDKLVKMNISLISMKVIDDKKRKVGKVTDFAMNSKDYIIEQLNVSHGFMKSISSSGLIIGRNQIIEINDNYIIVKSPEEKIYNKKTLEDQVFVNPFATSSSPESTDA